MIPIGGKPHTQLLQQYLQQVTLSVDSQRESSFAYKTDFAALANMTLERSEPI